VAARIAVTVTREMAMRLALGTIGRGACAAMGMALLVLVAGNAATADEKIRFPAHDADRAKGGPDSLDGVLWSQPGAGPHPAIVMMHGCGGLRGRDGRPTARHQDWAERFAARGFVVLHVDSFAARGLREICSQSQRGIRTSVERAQDAYAALRFLQARPDIRPDAIVLLGWSNGGNTVLWTMASDNAARPVTLVQDYAAAVAFYPGCRSLAERRRGWTPVAPLLVLVGDADDWTPAEPCLRLAEKTGAAMRLLLYPGALHDFDAPDMAIHVRRNVPSTQSGTATLGTDPAARADAIVRVPAFVDEILGALRPSVSAR
jgi:dienelactone hydrolase